MILGPDEKPLNEVDGTEQGIAEIDSLIDGLIAAFPHWRDVILKRREQVTDSLFKIASRVKAMFQGAELPNVKSANGQLAVRMLADAALQVMIQRRLEERKDEIELKEVTAGRERMNGGEHDAPTGN